MPVRAGTSARKAGLIGAVFGLTLVAVFVVAVRLTYRPPPKGTAAAQPTMKTQVAVASVVVQTPPPSVHEPTPSTSGAGDPLKSAQAQPKRNVPAARPIVPAGTPARPGGAPSEGVAAIGTPVAGANSSASPTGAGQGAADENAPSLIPVIPQGPPPEVDPLVKAVLEEDNPHRK